MTIKDIIKHYKSYWGLEDVGISDADKLIIGWGDNLKTQWEDEQALMCIAYSEWYNMNVFAEVVEGGYGSFIYTFYHEGQEYNVNDKMDVFRFWCVNVKDK